MAASSGASGVVWPEKSNVRRRPVLFLPPDDYIEPLFFLFFRLLSHCLTSANRSECLVSHIVPGTWNRCAELLHSCTADFSRVSRSCGAVAPPPHSRGQIDSGIVRTIVKTEQAGVVLSTMPMEQLGYAEGYKFL
jgi:hypothetical protein